MTTQTVRDRLDIIKKRNGQHLTRYKFLYRTKTQLRRKYNEVYFWLILVDAIDGSSTLFEWTVKRAAAKTGKQWADWFKTANKGHKAGVEIFTENVLPNVNERSSHDWQFARFVGFGSQRVF